MTRVFRGISWPLFRCSRRVPKHIPLSTLTHTHKQTETISKLQKLLSDANVNVDVEREEAAHLRAEAVLLDPQEAQKNRTASQPAPLVP